MSHVPYGERHAYTRIPAAWASRHCGLVAHSKVKEFFEGCFAFASGDNHAAVSVGEALVCYFAERRRHGWHQGELSFGKVALGKAFDDESAYAAVVELGDIAVSVAYVGAECGENGSFGVEYRTAVDSKIFQAAVVAAEVVYSHSIER